MCPPGYHYIAIVIPALGHRDVYIYIYAYITPVACMFNRSV